MTLTTTLLLVCSALGTNPVRHVEVDSVELIEFNHFYDEQGRHVFDQMIFYDWSQRDLRYQIRDWRLIKNANQAPRYDAQRGVYAATWHDGLMMRQVRGAAFRETWTQYDPELIERSHLPKEQRRELTDSRRAEQIISLPVNLQSSSP
jgi:hypothetical protein